VPGRTFAAEADEYRELDAERVLVLTHYRARDKHSGLEVEQMRAKGAPLYYVRGGKVTRLVQYFDSERVLADPASVHRVWCLGMVGDGRSGLSRFRQLAYFGYSQADGAVPSRERRIAVRFTQRAREGVCSGGGKESS
jgi:hypothetical protein